MHENKTAHRHEESASPEVQPGDDVILRPSLLDPEFGVVRALKRLFDFDPPKTRLDLPLQFKRGKALEFQFETEVQTLRWLSVQGKDKTAEVETIVEILEVIGLIAERAVASHMDTLGNRFIQRLRRHRFLRRCSLSPCGAALLRQGLRRVSSPLCC